MHRGIIRLVSEIIKARARLRSLEHCFGKLGVTFGPTTVETSTLDPHAATNPVLIVEVLSDSTESYDRGQKFAHYRRLPSLREYLLVSQREPRIEAYSRQGESEWLLREAVAGETLTLASLEGVTLSIDRIYRNRLGLS